MPNETINCDLESIFRALSDRTRLRILNLLGAGELCVCDLVTVLEIPQPTASRHLAYLRNTGLVEVRKEGLWHYYSLVAAESEFQRKLYECVDACAKECQEFQADLKALKAVRRSCC